MTEYDAEVYSGDVWGVTSAVYINIYIQENCDWSLYEAAHVVFYECVFHVFVVIFKKKSSSIQFNSRV